MSGIAADYATATGAIDDLVAAIASLLDVSEDDLADDYTNSQRDLLADARHRADQARALLDEITHGSLDAQSL